MEDFTLPHIFQMDSSGLQVDFYCSSTIFSDFFFGGNPAKFKPRAHLDSRPNIWTAWNPSHYTVDQPDSIWSLARVYNYCLIIIVIIKQGKKMPWPRIEHSITWASINAAINCYTIEALLALQILHFIYHPSQHVLKADRQHWLCCHIVVFCLPTTTSTTSHLVQHPTTTPHSTQPPCTHACQEEDYPSKVKEVPSVPHGQTASQTQLLWAEWW